MPNCISCGRELPSPNEPHNICPECRAAIMARAQSSAPLRTRRRIAFERIPVTTAIIAVNVVVFVLMVASGVSAMNPTNMDIVRWGANASLPSLLTQPWRLLTSNYVHVGLIHIALNMWCLLNLGALAEQIFDRWAYVIAYTMCGIAGSMASLAFHPARVGAGASGAIFGLAGALIAALYLGHLPIHPGALKSTLKSLVSFAVYNLFFGAVVPAIDNTAHIGGLITGLILGAALAPRLAASRDQRSGWQAFVFSAAAVLLFVGYRFLRQAAARYLPPPLVQ